MSLKAFHLFFITVSVLLCLGFGAWSLGSDYAHERAAYAAAGWISFGLAVVLVVYELMFLRKFKDN